MSKYYEDDFDDSNSQRLRYFDEQFKDLANEVARAKGITLSQYLSQIRNITTFKEILRETFNQDASLGDYVGGMNPRGFRLFFERPIIQDIVEANVNDESELIEEIIPKPRPVDVRQIQKRTRSFFRGSFKEKNTGKTRRVVGYESTFKIKGKKITRLRDSKGRFVKRS